MNICCAILVLLISQVDTDAEQQVVPDVPGNMVTESSSGIEFQELSSFQMESLELLGRVWAFLKYHHPLPCSGEVNWDHEMFRVLPSVLAATTMPQREEALMGLLPSVDPLPPVELSPPPVDSIHFKADHSWIKGSEIGNSLAFLLNSVLEGRHTGASHYVRRGVPPVFHEEEYSLPALPDGGYRLLSMYRFYGFFEYWYPLRQAAGVSGGELLALNLPYFVSAGSAMEYQLAVKRMLATLGDSRCQMLNEPPEMTSFHGRFHLPVRLVPVEGSWVIDGFLHESMLQTPLRRGDVLLSVDGAALEDIAEGLRPFVGGSTPGAAELALGEYLLRGSSETASLVIERGGQRFELSVARVPGEALQSRVISLEPTEDESFYILSSGFGFIDDSRLSSADVDMIRENFSELPGIVIDMRGNAAEDVLYEMAEFLLPEAVAFRRVTGSTFEAPGTLRYLGSVPAGGGGASAYTGPVALLVDRRTTGAAEFQVMAWRLAPGCRVFGDTTGGAPDAVNRFILPGGMEAGFTGLGTWHPDGTPVHRRGIPPDFPVAPTIQGLQADRDEVLEAALGWLGEQR